MLPKTKLLINSNAFLLTINKALQNQLDFLKFIQGQQHQGTRNIHLNII